MNNNRFANLFGLSEAQAIALLDKPQNQIGEDDSRYVAASQLAFCPSNASIDALIRAIHSTTDTSLDNRIARRKAIESLGKLQADRAINEIASCLNETGDTYTIENAVWSIGEIGTTNPEILAAITRLLSIPNQSYRAIIHTLAKLDYKPAVSEIQRFTDHEDKTIASAAIATVYRFTGDDSHMEEVMEFLFHPNVYTRRLCIQDLIDTNYYQAIPEITKAPVSLVFRMRGLRSLGTTGFDAGVTTPEKLLPYAEQVLYDHPKDLQLIHAYDRTPTLQKLIQELYDTDFARAYRASLTLIEDYPDEAGPALLETYIQQAREDYGGHYHVMKLLGWLKYAPGYATLLEGLNISAPQFMKSRAAAAIALGELGNPEAIPALVICLDSKLWDLRFAALVALEKLEHRDGLAIAINDPDWMVQTKAQSLTRGK